MAVALPLIYDACRRTGIAISACDLSCWSSHGVLPYLTAWDAGLDASARSALGPEAAILFAPLKVPVAAEIVLAAELRFCAFAGATWPPPEPSAAAKLAAAAVVDGDALRASLEAQAARLLRLAGRAADLPATEPRALAALCLACARYRRDVVVAPDAEGRRAAMPWTAADAATRPAPAEARVFAAFAPAVAKKQASRRAVRL